MEPVALAESPAFPARRAARPDTGAAGETPRLLDWLCQMFEPGRVYTERSVKRALRSYHPDPASIRRYLVDEGFMDRRDGLYWRSGGTFEVD